MARSDQTIHDMFDALQKQFGAFPMFEDVPTVVLDAEEASEAHLGIPPTIDQNAAA